MKPVALWSLVGVGACLAATAGTWVVVARPAQPPAVAGLILLFLLGTSAVAFGISERHSFAPTRARRAASSVGAGALATGLLAAVLAVPSVTDGPRVAEPRIFPTFEQPGSSPTPALAETPTDVGPAEISVDQVLAFFTESYFPAALTNPSKALEKYGSTNFRRQKKRTGMAAYTDWYGRTRGIPIASVKVARYHQLSSTFVVSFTRLMRSGPTQHPKIVFLLSCAKPASSGQQCSLDDLRIDGSDRLT